MMKHLGDLRKSNDLICAIGQSGAGIYVCVCVSVRLFLDSTMDVEWRVIDLYIICILVSSGSNEQTK